VRGEAESAALDVCSRALCDSGAALDEATLDIRDVVEEEVGREAD
jgi:hypothetical protein